MSEWDISETLFHGQANTSAVFAGDVGTPFSAVLGVAAAALRDLLVPIDGDDGSDSSSGDTTNARICQISLLALAVCLYRIIDLIVSLHSWAADALTRLATPPPRR